MKTIIEVIESRLNNRVSNFSFTYLDNGEITQKPLGLNKLQEKALKIARLLPRKTIVLLLLPQGISFINAFFGCLYAQAIAVPTAIPTKNRGLEKLKSIISDAEISFGITNQNTIDDLHKWCGKDDWLSKIHWFLIENIEQETNCFSQLPELPKPEQIAFLQYTSGSTGNPKGVVVTHENIIANSKIIRACFHNTAESISVCWLPSFHDMGLMDGIIQPVFSNFQSVLMSPTYFLQKPIRWFKAITEYKATYSGGPNFAFDLCATRIKDEELAGIDLSSLRCLYNGSEPIRPQTMRKFADRFSAVGFSEQKLFTCYGLAEATLAVTTSKLGVQPTIIRVDEKSLRQNRVLLTEDESSAELVGCGGVYLDTRVKIVNPATLRECGEQEIGEVWVSGKSITSGYLNVSPTDYENFAASGGKRFLRTGDLGFLFNNELFVTGRIKDLIIIRGTNHYPQDIEKTTSSSHQALEINSCAAFSVEINKEEKLIVVQELKRTFRQYADYKSIFSRIMAEINQRHGIAPHDIVLISPNTLSKTTSGKIQRGKCRRLWQLHQLSSLAALHKHLSYRKTQI